MAAKKKTDEPKATAAIREIGISDIIANMKPDKLKKLIEEEPNLKAAVYEQAVSAANESTHHKLRVFPEDRPDRENDDNDMSGKDVLVPGTGVGKRSAVFRTVSVYDYKRKYKKQGFITREKYEQMQRATNTIVMWDPENKPFDVFADMAGSLTSSGWSMEKRES